MGELLSAYEDRTEIVDFAGLHVTLRSALVAAPPELGDLARGLIQKFPVVAPLWRTYESGELFRDETFGQMGLRIHSPSAAADATLRRSSTHDELHAECDLVIGEFLGDADMLIVTIGGDVVASIGSSPRDEWARFSGLEDFFATYTETTGEKPST